MTEPTVADLEYDDLVKAHGELIKDHGLADGEDIIKGAQDIDDKQKNLSFPDGVSLLAAIGAYLVQQERAKKRIFKHED